MLNIFPFSVCVSSFIEIGGLELGNVRYELGVWVRSGLDLYVKSVLSLG